MQVNFSSDIDPEENKKEQLDLNIKYILWRGILLGLVICVCIFGLMQQLAIALEDRSALVVLAQQFWLHICWWYWLVPLVVVIFAYRYLVKKARNRLHNG